MCNKWSSRERERERERERWTSRWRVAARWCVSVHVTEERASWCTWSRATSPWRRPPLTRRASCFQPSFARGGEEEPVPLSHPRASSGSTRASILPRRLFAALTLVKPSSTTRKNHPVSRLSDLSLFFFFFFSLLPPRFIFTPPCLGYILGSMSYKERKKGDVRLILNTIHIYIYIYMYICICIFVCIYYRPRVFGFCKRKGGEGDGEKKKKKKKGKEKFYNIAFYLDYCRITFIYLDKYVLWKYWNCIFHYRKIER